MLDYSGSFEQRQEFASIQLASSDFISKESQRSAFPLSRESANSIYSSGFPNLQLVERSGRPMSLAAPPQLGATDTTSATKTEVGPKGEPVVIDPTGLKIDMISGSPEFQQIMFNEIEKMPGAERKLLAEHNISYSLANKLADVDPELATEHPRGWPPGKTWNDVDGGFMSNLNTVALAESTNAGKSNRLPGVMRHETGHAFDQAMGQFSQSPEFQVAYSDDVANMPVNDQHILQYLLQPGEAGKQETAAEVYGGINGSTANFSQTQMILRDFPEVVADVKQEEQKLA